MAVGLLLMYVCMQLIVPLIDVADGGRLLQQVQSTLQPILEEWSGVELVLQRCHGLREYLLPTYSNATLYTYCYIRPNILID